MECPICKGTGILDRKAKRKYTKTIIDRKAITIELRKKGLSERRIAPLIGFKNHASVRYLLKKKGEK